MAAMAARAVWKGNISFGLEDIPILLFIATQKEDYRSLNELYENGLETMRGCG
jgi:non-homologous end joining protein Ku